MADKSKPVPDDLRALENRIAQTFEIDRLDALAGLSEHLRAIGHKATASALEQLMARPVKQGSGSR